MRFVSTLILCVGLSAALGCGGKGKTTVKEATAEEIQMQKESAERVKSEESEMRKKQPTDKTRQQTVADQERARNR